jgi:phosphoribosylformimino-5-aminoimidazole carboxamide ribotide isomerase
MITIIPAIDLKDGRCVRLCQGRADDVKVYSEDPVEMAVHWVAEGAVYLHVVDLDGAFQGTPVHRELIAEIVKAAGVPVEVGGGLRTDADVASLLECGVDRAIIGTRAIAGRDALEPLVRKFGAGLAVGIDARDGMVQVKGWMETTSVKAVELAAAVDAAGVKTLICTDTGTDGMLKGTNVQAMAEVCAAVSCSMVASGGITTRQDVDALCDLKQDNLIGAIVGKALYEGRVSLKDLTRTD